VTPVRISIAAARVYPNGTSASSSAGVARVRVVFATRRDSTLRVVVVVVVARARVAFDRAAADAPRAHRILARRVVARRVVAVARVVVVASVIVIDRRCVGEWRPATPQSAPRRERDAREVGDARAGARTSASARATRWPPVPPTRRSRRSMTMAEAVSSTTTTTTTRDGDARATTRARLERCATG